MGRLLHSKTFRNNLFKWILLYIGALVVITSVVTYSKYITAASGYDTARTAKFNINVTQDSMCSTLSPTICGDSIVYKPYDSLEYKFSIDTSDLEVRADLVFTIEVNGDFKIVSISDDTNTVSTPVEGENQILSEVDLTDEKISYLFETDTNNGGVKTNKMYIYSEAGIDKVIHKQYTLTIKYRRDELINSDYSTHNYNDANNPVVKVSYSATQKN